MGSKIKAVKYKGAFKVAVEEVDMPKLEHADDVLVKVTTACTTNPNSKPVRAVL